MTTVIFDPTRKKRQVPVLTSRRMQPSVIRALAGFQAAVAWVYATFINAGSPSMPEAVVDLRDVPEGFRPQLEEVTILAVRSLDPQCVAIAKLRTRQAVAERLAMRLHGSTDIEMLDPGAIQDLGNELADVALERYRIQLVYGTPGELLVPLRGAR